MEWTTTRRINRKSNVVAIGMALLLSLVVYIALTNSEILPANLPMQGATFVENSDLTMSVEGETILLRAGKTLEQVQSLSLLWFYNPEEVNRDENGIQSDYPISVAEGDEGEVTLIYTFPVPVTLNAGSEILRLEITGDPYEMTFSDVLAIFADDTQENLSLGLP